MGDRVSRVIITTECNLKCSYCCNKLPKVQSTFKMTTLDMFLAMDYDVINISGGEPMLAPKKLRKILRSLDKCGDNRIYLYTNGLITAGITRLVKHLDGVNIGCHGNFDESLKGALVWRQKMRNVRLHAQKGKLQEWERYKLDQNDIQVNEWVMDECDNDYEDRWII